MAARNLITDIAGVRVGHAEDARLASGVTAIIFDEPAGAGLGATTVNLRGGLASASAAVAGDFTVGALAVVNAAGSAVIGDGPWFWAAPFERDAEFGGRGLPAPIPPQAFDVRTKGGPI